MLDLKPTKQPRPIILIDKHMEREEEQQPCQYIILFPSSLSALPSMASTQKLQMLQPPPHNSHTPHTYIHTHTQPQVYYHVEVDKQPPKA
jgi:hypothetical protein